MEGICGVQVCEPPLGLLLYMSDDAPPSIARGHLGVREGSGGACGGGVVGYRSLDRSVGGSGER